MWFVVSWFASPVSSSCSSWGSSDSFPLSSSLVDIVVVSFSLFDQSLAWFDKALSIDPNYVESMIGIGLVNDRLDNPAEARKWFNKALTSDPNVADSLANAGLTLSNSTEYQETVGWLDRLILTDIFS
jgi:tetratricopeptide (TPR) repeat protein